MSEFVEGIEEMGEIAVEMVVKMEEILAEEEVVYLGGQAKDDGEGGGKRGWQRS